MKVKSEAIASFAWISVVSFNRATRKISTTLRGRLYSYMCVEPMWRRYEKFSMEIGRPI